MSLILKSFLACSGTFVVTTLYSWADLRYGFVGRSTGAAALLLLNLAASQHSLKVLLLVGPLLGWGVNNGDLIPIIFAAFVMCVSHVSTLSKEYQLADDVRPEISEIESRIRSYLLDNRPSKLHKVDMWLATYKGKEEALYNSIVKKYAKAGSATDADDDADAQEYQYQPQPSDGHQSLLAAAAATAAANSSSTPVPPRGGRSSFMSPYTPETPAGPGGVFQQSHAASFGPSSAYAPAPSTAAAASKAEKRKAALEEARSSATAAIAGNAMRRASELTGTVNGLKARAQQFNI